MKRALPLVALLLLPACSGGDPQAAPAPEPLRVFAAASLTDAFHELGREYERAHPGESVTFSFAGSQTLVAQVQQGAPADVVATADAASGQALAAELDGPAQVVARNRLAIVHAPGDPLGLDDLADLARPSVKVVLAGPSVPAGRAARSALEEAGVQVRPVSEEPDVRAVVQRVALGEADAGIVYVTDLRAADAEVDGTELPGVSNEYPAGVVRDSAQRDRARAFLDLALSERGRAVLSSYGFLPP